jgi:hypothetical protein
MMQINVSVRGLAEARRALRRAGVQGVRIMNGAIQDGARDYRDFLKRMRPVSARTTGYGVKGLPKDKGDLARQIQKRKLQMMAAGVYGGAEYDPFVQEGTKKMPARPYMEWGLEMGGQRVIEIQIERGVQRIADILLS